MSPFATAFYFYILIIVSIPAIVLGLLGKLSSTIDYEMDNTEIAVKAIEKEEIVEKKTKAKPLKRKMVLLEATEAVDEPVLQKEIEAVAVAVEKVAPIESKPIESKPKKTTRKAKPKKVEFDIVEP